MARCLSVLLATLALCSASLAQPGGGPSLRPGVAAANAPAAISPSAASAPVPGTLARPRRENPVVSIQEFVRLEGYMSNTLRGIGIVTGLKGTGDDGKDLVLARPLAKVYENNGNPLPDLRDLSKAKSAALVTLSVVIPEGGGREGDTFDVLVQCSHSASSLKGGTLIVSPLLGPTPGAPVFAMASGQIVLDDAEFTTSGRIRNGATLIRDIRPARVGEGRGWGDREGRHG